MVKKLKKSFVFKHFYADLLDRYGADRAKEIWTFAENEYHRLMTNEPSADKSSITYVFPAVSLYRSVEKFYPEDALSVTRSFGTKTGLRLKNIFQKITYLPGVPALIWKNMDRIAEKMSSGYETKNMKVNEEQCFMDVVRCPLYDKAFVKIFSYVTDRKQHITFL
ncbi:MAG: hypothetical protein K6G03_07675 [Lachnospiraceae bacterium]|nr:hypothetical protein [Lachnospiraceae bacterium]